MVLLVWHYTTTCTGVGKTVAGEGRTGLGHPYQSNQSTASAGFWTTPLFTLSYCRKQWKNVYYGPLLSWTPCIISTFSHIIFKRLIKHCPLQGCFNTEIKYVANYYYRVLRNRPNFEKKKYKKRNKGYCQQILLPNLETMNLIWGGERKITVHVTRTYRYPRYRSRMGNVEKTIMSNGYILPQEYKSM